MAEAEVQLSAEMSDLDLEKATIKHEFSSPWEDSDLILVVEDQKLHVHRTILKMTSPVFKAMLSSEFEEKDAKEVTLPGKKVNEFVDLLRQIYPINLGNQITLENIKHIYSLADEYQISKVMNDCRMFLSSAVGKTKENAIDMLLLAQDIGAEEARQQCYDVLNKMTFKALERKKGFSDLNGESMRHVFLDIVRRYYDCMNKVLPELLGTLDTIVHIWNEIYKTKPSKCSKHEYGRYSTTQRIRCKTCKEMFTQALQKVGRSSNPTGNIVSLMEEMMVLTQEL